MANTVDLDRVRHHLREAVDNIDNARLVLQAELARTRFANDDELLSGILVVRAWGVVLSDLLETHALDTVRGVLDIVRGPIHEG